MRAAALGPTAYDHGEGIRWDAAHSELLWVDIGAGRFLRAAIDDVETPIEHRAGRPVGAVAPLAAGGWLLAAGRGLLVVDEDGGQREAAVLEPEGVRMNDAACDPAGRLWAGSMAYDGAAGAGSLHRLDLDGGTTTVLRGLTISNGLGWSPDGTVMYLNDSGPSVTWAFDYDAETGEATQQRVLAEHTDGLCDGMTVDDEGCLWIALWGGSAVDRLDPEGRRIRRIDVPAVQPSDCCLVNTTLVITSARHDLTHPSSDDGRLYAVDVGVSGPPVQAYRGALPG